MAFPCNCFTAALPQLLCPKPLRLAVPGALMPPLALQPAVMLPHEPLHVLFVTEWRFNKQLEDMEWLLECESSSGLSSTFTWAPLRTISSSDLWECVQAFLLPRLLRLRSMCKSAAVTPEEPKECGVLFDPEPHAFRPWRKDFVLDWRHSKASGQLLFLVRRHDEVTHSVVGDEWLAMRPGDTPLWHMVKNYLLQYIFVEATYSSSATDHTTTASGTATADHAATSSQMQGQQHGVRAAAGATTSRRSSNAAEWSMEHAHMLQGSYAAATEQLHVHRPSSARAAGSWQSQCQELGLAGTSAQRLESHQQQSHTAAAAGAAAGVQAAGTQAAAAAAAVATAAAAAARPFPRSRPATGATGAARSAAPRLRAEATDPAARAAAHASPIRPSPRAALSSPQAAGPGATPGTGDDTGDDSGDGDQLEGSVGDAAQLDGPSSSEGSGSGGAVPPILKLKQPRRQPIKPAAGDASRHRRYARRGGGAYASRRSI